MITTWQMYWLTRLTDIQGYFCGIAATAGIGAFIVFVGCAIASDCGDNFNKRWFYLPAILSVVALVSGATGSLIPSTKDMAAILIVPKLSQTIAANKEIQKLPDNLLSLANDWIEELKPKQEKTK